LNGMQQQLKRSLTDLSFRSFYVASWSHRWPGMDAEAEASVNRFVMCITYEHLPHSLYWIRSAIGGKAGVILSRGCFI